MTQPPGPLALAAVGMAETFVGVREQGYNTGLEVDAFLRAVALEPGQPWCAAFVRYCFEQAVAKDYDLTGLDRIPDTGWADAYAQWGRRGALWLPVGDAMEKVRLPARGDLACFYFAAKGRVAHIGFVAGLWENAGVVTVEGNTGPPVGTVNRDGDGVYLKHRRWRDFGDKGGFVRVPW